MADTSFRNSEERNSTAQAKAEQSSSATTPSAEPHWSIQSQILLPGQQRSSERAESRGFFAERIEAQQPNRATIRAGNRTNETLEALGCLASSGSQVCAIQVRLFDGSSIRARFPVDHTVGSHVRPWIDASRVDGDGPYTLLQVLTPGTNRMISISEEGESLQFLTPSATLIMVPIRSYTQAFEARSNQVPGAVSVGLGLLSRGSRYIATMFGSAYEGDPVSNWQGRAIDANAEKPQEPGYEDQGQGRTVLYNGNQLALQPYNDEERASYTDLT